MANIFGYDEVEQGTDWQKVPKHAYLAVGTELTYNGRRIRLVRDADTDTDKTCSSVGCVFKRWTECKYFCQCMTVRKDHQPVHWEYVDTTESDGMVHRDALKSDVSENVYEEHEYGETGLYKGRKIRLVGVTRTQEADLRACRECVFLNTRHCCHIPCKPDKRPTYDDRVYWEYVEDTDATGKPELQELTKEVMQEYPAIGSLCIWNGRVVRLEEDTRPLGCREGCPCRDAKNGKCLLMCGPFCSGVMRPDGKMVCWKYVDDEHEKKEKEEAKPAEELQELTTEIMKSHPPIGSEYMWKGRKVRLVADTSAGGCSSGGCAVRISSNDCPLSCGIDCKSYNRPDGNRVHLVFADECTPSDELPRDSIGRININAMSQGTEFELDGVKYKVVECPCLQCALHNTHCGDKVLCTAYHKGLRRVDSHETDKTEPARLEDDPPLGTVAEYNGRKIQLCESTESTDCGACALADMAHCVEVYGFCAAHARADKKAVHWKYVDGEAITQGSGDEGVRRADDAKDAPRQAPTCIFAGTDVKALGAVLKPADLSTWSTTEGSSAGIGGEADGVCASDMECAQQLLDEAASLGIPADEVIGLAEEALAGGGSVRRLAQELKSFGDWKKQQEQQQQQKENGTMTMFDKIFDFNGNFGKAPEGMFRISMRGAVAVRTSAGYRAYNMEKGRLVNCTMFNLDMGDGMFYILPTNSVKAGDIILVNKQPRCVLDVRDRTIAVVNYEAGTVEQLLPERHMFMGNMYFYGKVVSPLLGLFGKSDGIKGILQMKLMSELFGGKAMGEGDKAGLMQMMLFSGMLGREGAMCGMFDGMFGCFDDEEEAPRARPRGKGKAGLPKKVDIEEDETPEDGEDQQ